ncbi:MAG: hypothetical protein ACK4ND_02340 [Cytophagaceae bacterium]
MRLTAITLIIFVFGFALLSFQGEKNRSLANVAKEDGYYIFIKSTPTVEYEVLGEVELNGIVKDKQFATLYGLLMKKVKKEYPKSDAILFDDHKMFKAKAIMFK